jgi:hypothetical protein
MKDWTYCFLLVVTRHLALAIPQKLCSSSLLVLLEAARIVEKSFSSNCAGVLRFDC